MTNHYKVHIIIANATLKVSYRNGKFFKLEKLTGKLTEDQVKKIGFVVPPLEDQMKAFEGQWKDKVSYTPIEKKTTVYNQFLDTWFSFYDGLMGMKPQFNAADGNHLKKIINYLKTIEPSDTDALNLWQLILTNWNSLDDFYKNNADLKFISSQINKIFQNVKRISENGQSGISADYLERIKRDLQS